jgi:hypothetical protein
MKPKKTMLLIMDSSGRIVAAAHRDEGTKSQMSTGVRPLPGQEILEMEVPEVLMRLESGHDFHLALAHARFDRIAKKLVFPDVTFKKVKH